MMECTSKDKVLEIGIGTGTSYKYYPMETEVTGIDISPDMLEKAKKNIRKPVVAIGGINNLNYKKLLSFGAKYIAISSYIWDNPKLKPEIAIRKFK